MEYTEIDHKIMLNTAFETGYSDAYYDGIDTFNSLECKCNDCAIAYDNGRNAGVDALR